jgi:hypothetical protein
MYSIKINTNEIKCMSKADAIIWYQLIRQTFPKEQFPKEQISVMISDMITLYPVVLKIPNITGVYFLSRLKSTKQVTSQELRSQYITTRIHVCLEKDIVVEKVAYSFGLSPWYIIL